MLDTRVLPAFTTLIASIPPAGEQVGGSPSLEIPYGSAAEPFLSERTTLDVAMRSVQTSTPSTATGVIIAPMQQNTLNVLHDQRGEPSHRPASNTRDFRQGAYMQQDHEEGRLPGFLQLPPLAHIYDSAGRGDLTQTTYEHWHQGNTLPPIMTQFEQRQNSPIPLGHDRWRGQRQYLTGQYHTGRILDTYESHIMENRHTVPDPDGGRPIPVHGTSHMGPRLKPLDPPATELVAQKQQLYALRQQEAEEYPVAYTF